MRFIAAFILLLPLLGVQSTLAEENTGAPAAGTPTPPAAASATPAGSINADTATATEEETPDEVTTPVYLVARIKLSGTDLTQVIFFHHSALNTLEACEIERNAGLTTGWNYFSLRGLKTPKGVSYKVDYLCVESEQRLSYWNRRLPMDQFYFVRTTDKKLVIEAQSNFFHCRRVLRERTREESIDAFCALSSQLIQTAPPTAVPASTAPAPAATPMP